MEGCYSVVHLSCSSRVVSLTSSCCMERSTRRRLPLSILDRSMCADTDTAQLDTWEMMCWNTNTMCVFGNTACVPAHMTPHLWKTPKRNITRNIMCTLTSAPFSTEGEAVCHGRGPGRDNSDWSFSSNFKEQCKNFIFKTEYFATLVTFFLLLSFPSFLYSVQKPGSPCLQSENSEMSETNAKTDTTNFPNPSVWNK